MNLAQLQFEPARAHALHMEVRAHAMARSTNLADANFTSLADADVQLLAHLYNQLVFDGQLDAAVAEVTTEPLTYRVSSRMTRSGGMTIRRFRRGVAGPTHPSFEIVASSRLLLLSFDPDSGPVLVSGRECHDRLSALQRILEHELVHLLEWLQWGRTSCRRRRFRDIASRLFGHTASCHRLTLPEQSAARRHRIRVGQEVAFDFKGRRLVGRVNRINTRATVLTPDPRGTRYSDGRRYHKYYVPIASLTPA